MPRVRNKAFNVPDDTCRECSLYWNGECRAFKVPESDEERNKRDEGWPKCRLRDYGAPDRAGGTGISSL